MTLMETLIVITIMGILSTLLIRTYIDISRISLRVEQEKNITQEVLVISQTLQNYADRNQLDFERYQEEIWIDTIVAHKWIVKTLYLSGMDGRFYIQSNGDCIDPGAELDLVPYAQNHETYPTCRVEIHKPDQTIILTNPQKAYISQLVFKIIPYATLDQFIEKPSLCTNFLTCPHHPWFRIIAKAYSPNYSIKRVNNARLPVQQFFTIK